MSKEGNYKFLGANVPADIYWEFKTAAAEREETMQDAIKNAALLYTDAKAQRKED